LHKIRGGINIKTYRNNAGKQKTGENEMSNYIDGSKMIMVGVNVYETRYHGGAKLDLDSFRFSGEKAAALQLLTWLKGVNYAFINVGRLKRA